LRLYQIHYFVIQYILSEKTKIILSVTGISLGIALFVSTVLSGNRAEKSLIDMSLGFSSEEYDGKILSQLGLGELQEDEIYPFFRTNRNVSILLPMIQREVLINSGNKTIKVVYLGMDGFKGASPEMRGNSSLFISESLSEITKGQPIQILGDDVQINQYGVLEKTSGLYIVESIRDAQRRFHLENRVDHILYKSNSQQTFVLPQSWKIESKEEILNKSRSALKSYRLNLMILSLISVLVSFLMVSNIMIGIYYNRKKEFGILSCLGLSSIEVFLFMALLSCLLGLFGTVIGISLGQYVSKFSLFSGESTLTDMNQILSYNEVPWEIVILSFIIGIGGSFVSSIYPAWKAKNTSPLSMIRESNLSISSGFLLNSSLASILALILGLLVSRIPSPSEIPIFSLISIGLIILSSILSFPILLQALGWIQRRMNSLPLPEKIGTEEILLNPKSNILTSGTIMLTVTMVLCLSVLTRSYENSLLKWIESDEPCDFSIIRPDRVESGAEEGGISRKILKDLEDTNHVSKVMPFLLNTRFNWNSKILTIHASHFQIPQGSIEISDNLSFLENLKEGDRMILDTPKKGKLEFVISKVGTSFFSERGTIKMNLSDYDFLFPPKEFNSIRVFKKSNSTNLDLEMELKGLFQKEPGIQILDFESLKLLYLSGTKKVFRILDTLMITTSLISIVSVISFLYYNLMERRKIFTVLRVQGSSSIQMLRILFSHSCFLGLSGWIQGVISSLFLVPIILYGINQKAFGWRLDWVFPWDLLFYSFLLIPGLGLLSSLFPLRSLLGKTIRESLNFE
jgi:putative ABC transport system permease protein